MRAKSPIPLTRDVVLLGGGHAHALVLNQWAMDPLPGAALTLISPDPTTPYTGMLPGHIAGHYSRDEIEIDLIRLARKAGARIILDRTEAIDRQAKTVRTANGRTIAYDLLSLDIGVTAPIPAIPGAEHGHTIRPLAEFADAFAALKASVTPGQSLNLAVIGGGLGGVETAFAMQHALAAATPTITLIEKGKILSGQRPGTARALRRALNRAGIEVIEGTEVTGLTANSVRLRDREFPSDFTLFATGAAPQDWLAETGLTLERGFVVVDQMLRTSDPAIFAAGDCAHLSHAPRPKAGVFAVRQAPVLFDNLRAAATDRPLRPYHPQKDYLKLVSLGAKRALADRKPVHLTAPFLWHWKDRIDRLFMAKFAPPPFPPEPDGLLCAGCGSKVGRAVITSHMADAAGDDAALLGETRVISTDHLSAVTPDPGLMARIAAVHALGDIWAMGARPEAALAQVILPEMSPALQARWLGEIMTAAKTVFGAEGAAIIGGHTTQGAELTIGFTVTGVLDGPARTLAGARPGDALILTKPLGAGVLLAAEMRQLGDGRHIAALWEMMTRPQGEAAALLAAKAHAMTDVTGFGLAGHLMAMCRASGVGAQIDLAALPTYAGAEALAAKGLRSSIWAENVRDAPVTGPVGPRFDLLFDPQTCGGLLAAVPESAAERLVADLIAIGFPAARIGRIEPGSDLSSG